MRPSKSAERRASRRGVPAFFVLLALALTALLGLWGTQNILLENSRLMGQDLAQSYAADEEKSIAVYRTVIDMGMAYLQEQIADEASTDELEAWLTDYFAKAAAATGGESIASYAVINGKIVASDPFDGIDTYPYQNAPWYQQALAAQGEVIFTNAYTSAANGRQVVTVCAVDPQSGSAIVLDLFPENFEISHQSLDLPEDGAYYLCDASGTLLYYSVPFSADESAISLHVQELCRQIDAGTLAEDDASILDLSGATRGVYYRRTGNGWFSILTLPHSTVLRGLRKIVIWYTGVFVIFFLGAFFLWLRNWRLRSTVERTNDTIRVLGNSYYAIYRINLNTGQYEMIKGSDYVRRRLPSLGKYEDLLAVIEEVLNEETGRDFAKSFSLDNIRALSQQRIRDFGGDFLRRFNDQYRWVNVRLLLDESLSPGEAVLCFRQVEEEKQRQLQHIKLLEDALATADASEKSQMQFFSNMSHDMRTPLNVIIGMTELALRPGCEAEKVTDYLQKIDLSSKQLLNLINDILEISRLEQGRVALENRTFDVCETVRTCAQPFQAQAEHEGKQFIVHTDVQVSIVCGDPFRLTQILNNLLSNAIKFTQAGDQIALTLRQTSNHHTTSYLFTVQDTGTGMSQEFLPKLFEPYERETRFSSQHVSGTGLGMPIVKNLVAQMGGQITVESTLGQGSCFTVTLPFAPGEDLPAASQRPALPEVLPGRHVLLAEDNALNMEIATELLQAQDVRVTPAVNGREAVEIFRDAPPDTFDAILMDMQMPEMDGCSAAQAIRALPRPDARRIPIIALTANAFAEDIARTTQAGMNTHISKPIDPDLLYAALAAMIAESEAEKEETAPV